MFVMTAKMTADLNLNVFQAPFHKIAKQQASERNKKPVHIINLKRHPDKYYSRANRLA
jgi:hypothetical protein